MSPKEKGYGHFPNIEYRSPPFGKHFRNTFFFFLIINKQGRQEGIGHPVSTNLIFDSHICFFLLSFQLQL